MSATKDQQEDTNRKKERSTDSADRVIENICSIDAHLSLSNIIIGILYIPFQRILKQMGNRKKRIGEKWQR